jgi:para-nitrobenzyl esterase
LAAKLGNGVVRELGLTRATVDEIQSVSFDRLFEATLAALKSSGSPPGPAVDGSVLPRHPFHPAAPSISSSVPVLIGTTLHESAAEGLSMTETDLKQRLEKQYGQKSGRVFDALASTYPDTSVAERVAILNRYRLNSVTLAKRKALLRAAPVYTYIFAWQSPIFSEQPARAGHMSDVPFVFYNTDRCAHATGGTVQARQLAAKMSDAWVRFARTGHPGHAGLPKWPASTADRDETMFFNDRCEVKVDHDRELLAVLGEGAE